MSNDIYNEIMRFGQPNSFVTQWLHFDTNTYFIKLKKEMCKKKFKKHSRSSGLMKRIQC